MIRILICKTVYRNGAGNGDRTRDPQLGRLMLCQLSYSRIFIEHYLRSSRQSGKGSINLTLPSRRGKVLVNLVERGGCARSLRSLRLPRLRRGRRTSFPSFRRGKVLILHQAILYTKPGGEGRIRTSEGIANRFTVCPLWPLGNLSDTNSQFF